MDDTHGKKLNELPIAGCLHAPCQRGSVNIQLSSCQLCGQEDPEKITVLSEIEEKIQHSMGPAGGQDGMVYELQCDACGGTYKIGVITIAATSLSGPTELSSVFITDEKSKGKWGGSGIFEFTPRNLR